MENEQTDLGWALELLRDHEAMDEHHSRFTGEGETDCSIMPYEFYVILDFCDPSPEPAKQFRENTVEIAFEMSSSKRPMSASAMEGLKL